MKQELCNGRAVPLFDEGMTDLAAFIAGEALLGFDYDGTLAPLMADPRRAYMRARTATLFADVAERFACAVISGRARADVAALLATSQPFAIVGNHGVENGEAADLPSPRELLEGWRADLEERLEVTPGFVIEDKGYSLTVHYRRCPDRAAARRLALRAAAHLGGARVLRGVLSLNLVPAGFPHKGDALLRIAERAQCRLAVFIGDDRTDEDAFAVAPGRVMGIRVGEPVRTAARYYLQDQLEIDALLERILELRATHAIEGHLPRGTANA